MGSEHSNGKRLTSGGPDLRQCHATIKTFSSFSVKVGFSVFGPGAGEAECSVSTAIVAALWTDKMVFAGWVGGRDRILNWV